MVALRNQQHPAVRHTDCQIEAGQRQQHRDDAVYTAQIQHQNAVNVEPHLVVRLDDQRLVRVRRRRVIETGVTATREVRLFAAHTLVARITITPVQCARGCVESHVSIRVVWVEIVVVAQRLLVQLFDVEPGVGTVMRMHTIHRIHRHRVRSVASRSTRRLVQFVFHDTTARPSIRHTTPEISVIVAPQTTLHWTIEFGLTALPLIAIRRDDQEYVYSQ